MNPYEPLSASYRNAMPTQRQYARLARMVMTAICSVVFTLAIWAILVMNFDRCIHGFDHIVWSGTLWLSAIACTGLVGYSQHSDRPVLSCTIAFGIFGLTYMVCEGPIFGVVSEGGDPSITQLVVWNLVCLPVGVLAATELGSRLGHRHRHRNADKQSVAHRVASRATF